MEVSALRYSGGIGLHARSPLLRLQSDERLITLIRRGSTAGFEVLVARYHARLLAFCRHLLGSREDAEDVLQEVFSAAFNAILDDDRPINVRPWLYRIARNRSLNHLRRIQAVGVDSMDIHLSEHGATTADKVHEREEFRILVGDIQGLPETQRTALVLREMDALSYEQIAEAMETTVPSVKSLLVRARVSLAEAAQARMLTCEQVRVELGEVAEGLRRRPGALVRRHLRTCERCATFKGQLNETSKALTAVLPVGGFFLLRKLAILHIGHSAGAGAGSGASGASAAGQAAAVGSTAAAGTAAVMGSTTTGFLSASVGAIATKAVAGLAAAALVTAGAVEVEQPRSTHVRHHPAAATTQVASVPATTTAPATVTQTPLVHTTVERHVAPVHPHKPTAAKADAQKKAPPKATVKHTGTVPPQPGTKTKTPPPPPPGRTQTQTDATVLAGSAPASTPSTATTGCPATSTSTSTGSTPATASSPPPSTTTTTSTSSQTAPSTQSSDPSTTTTTTSSTPSSTSTDPATTTSPTPTTTTASTGASPDTAPDPSASCSSSSSGSGAAGSALTASGGVAP
ncbi:MAG TPA: RNA polymerase sigma factor [Solirubrobacteraceae bacterium]|jgi:RNA polymerase sigma factor (sigma-70 family)